MSRSAVTKESLEQENAAEMKLLTAHYEFGQHLLEAAQTKISGYQVFRADIDIDVAEINEKIQTLSGKIK